MNIAFVIAMIAVVISLGAVFLMVRASKAAAPKNRNGGEGRTASVTSSTGSDCGSDDSGGCDGGGGGD